MSTVVNTVELDRETVHYRLQVLMTHDGNLPWGAAFDVQDGGYRLWIYRKTEKGPKLVTHISMDAERKPDKASALVAVSAWAHEHFED